jgi:hypothetical protein
MPKVIVPSGTAARIKMLPQLLGLDQALERLGKLNPP